MIRSLYLAFRLRGPSTLRHRRCQLFFFLKFDYRNDHDQVADWMEGYAKSLDLNIWTSATVTNATQDVSNGKWTVTVKRDDGRVRVFNVNHIVFACGFGEVMTPAFRGMVGFSIYTRAVRR
jgi:cation diffusion facilitator CzcD-associated flavoprotein CzcO